MEEIRELALYLSERCSSGRRKSICKGSEAGVSVCSRDSKAASGSRAQGKEVEYKVKSDNGVLLAWGPVRHLKDIDLYSGRNEEPLEGFQLSSNTS